MYLGNFEQVGVCDVKLFLPSLLHDRHLSESIVCVVFREPNALDPPGVIKARYIERQYIQRWILKSRLNRT